MAKEKNLKECNLSFLCAFKQSEKGMNFSMQNENIKIIYDENGEDIERKILEIFKEYLETKNLDN